VRWRNCGSGTPAWAEAAERVTSNPWKHEVLPRMTVELIGLAVNAACTNLNPEGTRRHIRAALEAGASREEILTCSRWPLFSASTRAAWVLRSSSRKPRRRMYARRNISKPVTPVCDKVRARGGTLKPQKEGGEVSTKSWELQSGPFTCSSDFCMTKGS
jgi:hypothetical protein